MSWLRELVGVSLAGLGARKMRTVLILLGPVLGASVFLLLEELMSRITIYWHLPFGILLILAVLFLRGGISGFFDQLGRRRDG